MKALRDAMGNRLPAAQENQLRRIPGEKDEVQYGAKPKTEAEARRLIVLLEAFAAWAEAEMQRPR